MSALPMLIAGAGPGGLTAAHALLRRGVPVLVLERQPVLMPVGAGLLVQINAMRMLGALELAGPVVQAGVPVRRGTVDDAGGRLIQGSDIGVFADQLGSPCVAILRSALSEQLASRLPEGALRLGAPIAGAREAGDRVLVTLASGEEVEGRGLVGADGIHSAVRTAVFGPVKLRYSGYTCWRGIAPMLPGWEPGRMFERWGRGRRFGMAPVSGSQIYWFATLNAPAGGADEGDLRAKLLEIYAEFAEPVPTLLGSTPPAAILRNDISDLPEQPRWTLGRVALLGDAAHATTPNLGQGACQAIEDAVHLAAAVAKNTDLPQAFLAYEAARRARATGIVRTSWRFGQISQWENGLARALRDALFRLIPASATEGQVRELYDVQVPE